MHTERLKRLQESLQAHNVDCLALIAGTNLRYLTGLQFHLSERPVTGFFPVNGTPVLVAPALEAGKLAALPFEMQRFTYEDGEDPESAYRQGIGALPEVQRLGVEYLQMRVLELRLVQRHVPAAQVIDAGPVMTELRIRKDQGELEAMRRAVQIAEQALAEVVKDIRPGVTERQVAGQLSALLRKFGGGTEPFEAIVLGGPNTANPHGVPGDYAFKEQDVVLIDFGTTYHGYISDITRTFFLGEPSGRAREVYDVVQAANAAGRATARPGVSGEEVDSATRQVIVKAGYGRYFIHRTGHGIGLEGHEPPYMVTGNRQPLAPGMTFTIEPGIYIPGKIGVRIEDDVAITAEDSKSLTTYSRDLTILKGWS